MTARKPDGSRWFSRSMAELEASWALPHSRLTCKSPLCPLCAPKLDVVIHAGERSKMLAKLRALQAKVAEQKAALLQPMNRAERRAAQSSRSGGAPLKLGRPHYQKSAARRVRR